MIYVSFKINQDEIIKTICVQRKMPLNTCSGHCALKKNLKKLEDNEKGMQNHLKEKSELVYIQNTIENTIPDEKFIENRLHSFSYSTKKTIAVTIATFHPPTFS